MHWIDVIAKDLLINKENRIASGTSISGMIHIGNFTDIVIAEGINRAIIENGGKSRLIWIMDDMDPLRKVPPQLPKEYERYIGMPVSSLRWNDKETFEEHSTKNFIEAMKRTGIEPEIISSADMYKKGLYDSAIITAMQKSAEIRKIFENVSGSKRGLDWLPFNPVCDNCGKIATTVATDFSEKEVQYKCVSGIAGKQNINGCGYEGKTSIRNGKLTWRVEWAARWKILGITCEPFGKEHAAAGGSYDTSRRISEEVFGYRAPYPVTYEHILVAGKKMSKSLGNIITLEELLEVLPPEIIRFFFFRVKPTTHKDFEFEKEILQLVREYEHIERLYYGIEEPSKGEDIGDLKRIYEISQIKRPEKNYAQVSYTQLALLMQISDREEDILKMLERGGRSINEATRKRIGELLPLVKNFLSSSASESVRFSLKPELSAEDLAMSEPLKACLRAIADMVEKAENEEALTNEIYAIAKGSGLRPRDVFVTIYRLFLGKDEGPKVGTLLLALDKSFVLGRLRLEK